MTEHISYIVYFYPVFLDWIWHLKNRATHASNPVCVYLILTKVYCTLKYRFTIMTEIDQLQHEVVPDGIIQEAILKYSRFYINISLPRPDCEQ